MAATAGSCGNAGVEGGEGPSEALTGGSVTESVDGAGAEGGEGPFEG